MDTGGIHHPEITSPRGIHHPKDTSHGGAKVDTGGLHHQQVTSPRGIEVDTTGIHHPQVILVKAPSLTSVQTSTSNSEIIMDPRVTQQTRTTRKWVRWTVI